MKKCLGIIIVFLLTFLMQVNAAEIEIQPTLKSKSIEQNRVWSGTFQIVWNEFIDKYVHQPVRFREGTPFSSQQLNTRKFESKHISGKYYYKYTGRITDNTSLHIAKAIKRKFKETSDLFLNLELTPSPTHFIIYTMLKKDFVFLREFEKFGMSEFGKGMNAEYFGIGKNTPKNVYDAVKVLYYNNPGDFAIVLLTKELDEVYLYKNSANKEFSDLYKDMTIKEKKYTGSKTFGDNDELKVPNIRFDVTAQFNELVGKRVMGTNIYIDKAMETIKFNMDNKGLHPKTKTVAQMDLQTISDEEKPEPRYFFLDDTFVIFLKEKEKQKGTGKCYFALRVNDITLFQ